MLLGQTDMVAINCVSQRERLKKIERICTYTLCQIQFPAQTLRSETPPPPHR